MHRAARDALGFIEGMTRPELDQDVKTQYAVARALEVIGEAASRADNEMRAAYPDLPWGRMVGMRTILAHEYFRVDLDIVWQVVTESLPELTDRLEGIISSWKEP